MEELAFGPPDDRDLPPDRLAGPLHELPLADQTLESGGQFRLIGEYSLAGRSLPCSRNSRMQITADRDHYWRTCRCPPDFIRARASARSPRCRLADARALKFGCADSYNSGQSPLTRSCKLSRADCQRRSTGHRWLSQSPRLPLASTPGSRAGRKPRAPCRAAA